MLLKTSFCEEKNAGKFTKIKYWKIIKIFSENRECSALFHYIDVVDIEIVNKNNII